MNTTSMTAASRTMYTRLVTAETAAELLARYLGKSAEHWADFLRQDRIESRQEDGCPSFTWQEWNGVFAYKEHEIFGYIGRQHPRAFGFDSSTVPWGSGPLCHPPFSVGHEVDYERRGRLLISLQQIAPFEGVTKEPWLTPSEARTLATELTRMADYCDSHYFDFISQDVQSIDDMLNDLPGCKKTPSLEKSSKSRSRRLKRPSGAR